MTGCFLLLYIVLQYDKIPSFLHVIHSFSVDIPFYLWISLWKAQFYPQTYALFGKKYMFSVDNFHIPAFFAQKKQP